MLNNPDSKQRWVGMMGLFFSSLNGLNYFRFCFILLLKLQSCFQLIPRGSVRTGSCELVNFFKSHIKCPWKGEKYCKIPWKRKFWSSVNLWIEISIAAHDASFLSLLHLTIFFVSVKSYFRFRFYLAIISLLSCFND